MKDSCGVFFVHLFGSSIVSKVRLVGFGCQRTGPILSTPALLISMSILPKVLSTLKIEFSWLLGLINWLNQWDITYFLYEILAAVQVGHIALNGCDGCGTESSTSIQKIRRRFSSVKNKDQVSPGNREALCQCPTNCSSRPWPESQISILRRTKGSLYWYLPVIRVTLSCNDALNLRGWMNG